MFYRVQTRDLAVSYSREVLWRREQKVRGPQWMPWTYLLIYVCDVTPCFVILVIQGGRELMGRWLSWEETLL